MSYKHTLLTININFKSLVYIISHSDCYLIQLVIHFGSMSLLLAYYCCGLVSPYNCTGGLIMSIMTSHYVLCYLYTTIT